MSGSGVKTLDYGAPWIRILIAILLYTWIQNYIYYGNYGGAKMIKVRYSDGVEVNDVYSWLEKNCVGRWYSGWDWENWQQRSDNRIIQFEDSRDAALFLLRWT